MRTVRVTSNGAKLAQDVTVAGHRLQLDEEIEKGGDDTGPAPHEVLLSALGACTSMTLRLYADRKGWPLRQVRVTLNGERIEDDYIITRQVTLEGDLDPEQRQRLLEIADRCPVHRTLTGKVVIQTTAEPE